MKFERFKMHSLHIYIEQSCNFRYRWYIFLIACIFSFNRLIKITRIPITRKFYILRKQYILNPYIVGCIDLSKLQIQ